MLPSGLFKLELFVLKNGPRSPVQLGFRLPITWDTKLQVGVWGLGFRFPPDSGLLMLRMYGRWASGVA